MPSKPFPKGNKLAKGGARKGAGRKSDYFKEQMQRLATKQSAIDFLEGCIDGKDVEEFTVLQTGVQVPVKPSAAVRLKALEFAADRGFGKPTQELHQTGTQGINIFQLIREAEEERGLPSSFDNK